MRTLAFSLLVLLMAVKAFSADLPKEIRGYYDRGNFLASFSTLEERQSILKMMSSEPEMAAQLGGRQARVRDYLSQKSMVEVPKMPNGDDDTKAAARPPYFSLTRVLAVDGAYSSFDVKVCTMYPNEAAVRQMIVYYDKVAGDLAALPTFEERLRQFHANGVFAVHHWHLTKDGWKKEQADTVLLKLLTPGR